MSTKFDKASNLQQEDEVTPQIQHEELEHEEELVDVELQKQMQKVTMDESVFDQQTKQKEKPQKKTSKKKGQDFLEYANKNNIQIKLQYGEEDKTTGSHQKKKLNEQYSQQQQPSSTSKRQFKGNNYPNNGNNGGNNTKFKPSYNKGNQQERKGHNKFDAFNQTPFQYGQPQFPHQPQPQHQEITIRTNEQILSYLERLLSLTSLNRDLYLRYRINDKGMINILELANYYGVMNNEITPQKIIDVIRDNDSVSSIGVIEENGNMNVVIKHWNTISPQLNSIEEITAKKREMKMQQTKMGMQFNQNMPYTYIHMENNYFLPGLYEMQGYGNNNNNSHYHS